MSEETPQNDEELYKYLAQASVPMPEDKHNTHTFLFRVATADDTTKVANLTAEEIGLVHHPLRAVKEFALISSDIINNQFVSDYFKKESEIVSAPSLSKDGFLTKLAVTQTRQIADITKKPRAENKGWFKRKEPKDGESE